MSQNERTAELTPQMALPASSSEFHDNPSAQLPDQMSSTSLKERDPERFTEYEFIDSRELARRLTVPLSWVRDQVRDRSEDPLPHLNLGKYVRFLWGSPALELWIRRRIVEGNNRRLGRTRRKEQE
jgi:hypothetical protein